MNPLPPAPDIWYRTTLSAASTATEASTAFPPLSNICIPAMEARGCPEVTKPWTPGTAGRWEMRGFPAGSWLVRIGTAEIEMMIARRTDSLSILADFMVQTSKPNDERLQGILARGESFWWPNASS